MKCQMQQTQWVRQLLTASELHWFSLVVPTLTASMLSSNWLIFCQAVCQPLWSRLERRPTQIMLKKCLYLCNQQPFLHIRVQYVWQIVNRSVVTGCLLACQPTGRQTRGVGLWCSGVGSYLPDQQHRGTFLLPLSSPLAIDHVPGIESLSLPLRRWTAIIPIAQ